MCVCVGISKVWVIVFLCLCVGIHQIWNIVCGNIPCIYVETFAHTQTHKLQTRVCGCKACKGGKNCKIAVQSREGKGKGMRLLLNSAVEEDTPVTSAQNSRWYYE